jgi:hypothetical protein
MEITRKEAIKMINAKLECMTRDVSGTYYDCNRKLCDECDLNYEQGSMGEQKEYLRMAIQALEREGTLDTIITNLEDVIKFGMKDRTGMHPIAAEVILATAKNIKWGIEE